MILKNGSSFSPAQGGEVSIKPTIFMCFRFIGHASYVLLNIKWVSVYTRTVNV